MQSWNIEKLQFLNKLRNKVNVHFVLNNGNSAMTTQDKLTLIQLKAWAGLWQLQSPLQASLKTVCKIETDDGKIVEYLSEDFEQTFNDNWGSSVKGLLYKNPTGSLDELKMLDIDIDVQSVFVTTIEQNCSIQSNEIADLLLEKLNGSLDLKSLMQGHAFDIQYSDRYLNSPLSCILSLQFIDRLKNKLNFDIASFKFKGQSFTEIRRLRLLHHNFANASDRNSALLRFAQDLKIPNSHAVNEDLPHYRYFQFENEDIKITIRPDAGIAYGWFFDGNTYNVPFNNGTNARDIFTIKNEKQTLLFTVSVEKTT
jgi:DEAD/DEAH box helicase domain-containing protein